ncbi:MAG: hypothetical protein PHO12_09945 [Bacteroidales bacterium]|nr:hypothetical protein [Bacteroidales bacterium]
MVVKCVWHIQLPFKFDVKNDVIISEIIIDDVSILFAKSKDSKFYDFINVEYITDIDDTLLPKNNCDFGRTSRFVTEVTQKVGVKVNYFINSYYRQVETHIINQIFNGDDFTTEYEMVILDMEGNPVDSILISNTGVRVLDKSLVDRIINDVNNKDRSIVNEFMRLAACFLENGYFDMTVMNLANALEASIKGYVFSRGISVQDLNEAKGYVEKFFHVGLKKAKGVSLKENMPDYFESVIIINATRNEIAHGGSLQNIKQMTQYEIYDVLEDLVDEVDEIIKWIVN